MHDKEQQLDPAANAPRRTPHRDRGKRVRVVARLSALVLISLAGAIITALAPASRLTPWGSTPTARACGLGNSATMLANNAPALLYPVTSDTPADVPIGIFALQYVVGQNIHFDEDLSRVPNAPQKSSWSWHWSFGDGSDSTQITPDHAYGKPGTYYVHAQIYDTTSGNWTDIDSAQVAVIPATLPQPPVAQVKASAAGVAIGGSVHFDAAGSHAQVGSTLTYFWNFNDGATATGPQATHTFAVPGKGFVALIVTDGRGARSVATSPIVVAQALPTAHLTASATVVDVGDEIILDASSSVAPRLQGGNSILHYVWDFGDGTPPLTTESPKVGKTYTHEGTYTISLQALDTQEAPGVTTLSVTVRPGASASAGLWIVGILTFAGFIVALILGWPYVRRWEQQRRKQAARQAYQRARAGRKGK